MFDNRLGERLKSTRKNAGKTQEQVAQFLGVTRGAYSHLENNRNEPDNETLINLADYFDVSIDYLLGKKEKPYYQLSDKEKKDIGIEAERILEGLYTDSELHFYGEPMTDEDKERMKIILEMGLQLNKEKAKKKFTNKKYRNDSK